MLLCLLLLPKPLPLYIDILYMPICILYTAVVVINSHVLTDSLNSAQTRNKKLHFVASLYIFGFNKKAQNCWSLHSTVPNRSSWIAWEKDRTMIRFHGTQLGLHYYYYCCVKVLKMFNCCWGAMCAQWFSKCAIYARRNYNT